MIPVIGSTDWESQADRAQLLTGGAGVVTVDEEKAEKGEKEKSITESES